MNKKCPNCDFEIPADVLLKWGAAIMGAKGKGKCKARTSKEASKAAMARWNKYRASHPKP